MAGQNFQRLDLRRFPSLCAKRQTVVVSRDKDHPYRHMAMNPNGNSRLRHYHIDGDVLPANTPPKRCDFILFNDSTNIAYLIELKGQFSEIDPEQMNSTEKVFKDSLSGYRLRYRFVTGKSGTHSGSFLAWKAKKPKGSVVCEKGKGKNHSYEEII